MSSFQSFLHTTILEASDIARSYFGKTTSTTKAGDNNQVLTEADLAIGKHIIEKIQRDFPDHNIIDEEAGVIDNGSEYTWVIDPIDGTSNFANSVPTYGIMIGLLHNNSPLEGAIALPALQETYLASRGEGAYCGDRRIGVTEESSLLQSLVAYGIDGHQENPEQTKDECELLADIVLAIRNLRSSNSVFDCCMVARGSYGGYLNRSSKVWDNVAMDILVTEAGGVYTDFFGKPIQYADAMRRVDENYTACAGSQILHSKLQSVIHAHQSKR
jgi:myo-inositol-1(or 4)-monophosphatase